jgi:hypothetical protein
MPLMPPSSLLLRSRRFAGTAPRRQISEPYYMTAAQETIRNRSLDICYLVFDYGQTWAMF